MHRRIAARARAGRFTVTLAPLSMASDTPVATLRSIRIDATAQGRCNTLLQVGRAGVVTLRSFANLDDSMFGRSKPVVFDPYGRQRSRWPLPRWLVLLLIGIVLGVSGVLIVQEKYLPPRLTADASIKLRDAFQQADTERGGLRRDLATTTQKLDATTADNRTLTERLATSSQTTERLQKDMGSMIDLLPPDPRGGTVSVRAARFSIRGGTLDYEVLLTRGAPGSAPLAGVMQMSVAGSGGSGSELTKSVSARPQTVSVGAYASLRGSVELPAGFSAREATITVLDRPDGRVYGRRVMYVK
jgi:uncharacterized membrane-anchored protein YhcB (DUF1043 family)